MSSKKGSISNIIVWVIIALLVVGLGGFGISNFGGSATAVGQVGDREIRADDFYNALQQEVQNISAQTGQPVTIEQADQFSQFIYGQPLSQRILDQMIRVAALDGEAARLGISVGDEEVKAQILSIPAFQGIDGNFDRATYRDALRRNGFDEKRFETNIRETAAREIMQSVIVSNIDTPEAMRNVLLEFYGQRRSISVARLSGLDLTTEPGQPSEEDITEYYESNADAFTAPPRKNITFAWVTPSMLLDTVEVDEDMLREAYEERSDTYNAPERRLVERLVFASIAEAETAALRLTNGDISFDDLVVERGLALADIDMGDIAQTDLSDAAGAAVFGLDGPGITSVVDSGLGPALFRVNGILDAQITPFEEARPALLDELAMDRARRVIDVMVSDIDDRLAAGATLEEIADETELTLGEIGWFEGANESIAAYDEFAAVARSVTVDDFPELATLSDGGVFALRLDDEIDAELRPLDEVRNNVMSRWTEDEAMRLLTEQAEALANQLQLGVAAEDLGLEVETHAEISRDGFIDGTNPDYLNKVFELTNAGDVDVSATDRQVIITRLDTIHAPDMEDEETGSLAETINAQIGQDIAQDLFNIYTRELEDEAGFSINQAAINAILSQAHSR